MSTITLFMLTFLQPLPERTLNCHIKSYKAGTPLHGQQHQLTFSVSSQVGLHLTMPPTASQSRQKIHFTVISKNLH